MNRFVRITLTVPVLGLGLVLAGCESFDPTAVFDMEIFNTKKKLPGERRAVFPEGTPGVPQGVPQELVKGYQPPPEQADESQAQAAAQQQAQPAEAKPKPKPKPKVVAKPKEESTAAAGTSRPQRAAADAMARPAGSSTAVVGRRVARLRAAFGRRRLA